MKTIAFFNVKGGVAKTISTVNVAACIVGIHPEKKVLVVDIDPQGNASKYLNRYIPDDDENMRVPNINNVLLDRNVQVIDCIQHTDIPGIDIITSDIGLADAESAIITDMSRARENRLYKALVQVKDKYDYCLIDCPPSKGILTKNALVATDKVMIPIKSDNFALDGFKYLLKEVANVKEEWNEEISILGAFITMYRETTVNKTTKMQLEKALKDIFINISIHNNESIGKSTFTFTPSVLFDKKATSSNDYMELTKYILANAQ